MARTIELQVASTFDASEVANGFAEIGTAASDMAGTVADSADSVSDASDQMADVSATAKDVSTNSRLATGSLNAMATGLDLVGASGAAEALRTTGDVTKTLGGVGKGLTLVLKSQTAQMVLAKGALVAQAVATRTVAAATKAYTIGQWALNAAMAANPIGLVVIAIAALVAGFILAYNKSETFRKIVDTAMAGAKVAIGWVIDKVQAMVDLVRDKGGPIFETLSGAVGDAKGLIVGYFELMTTPIRTIIGLVQDLINLIADIDFPDIDIPGVRIAARGSRTSSPGAAGSSSPSPTTINNFNFYGFVGSERQLATEFEQMLRRNRVSLGAAAS